MSAVTLLLLTCLSQFVLSNSDGQTAAMNNKTVKGMHEPFPLQAGALYNNYIGLDSNLTLYGDPPYGTIGQVYILECDLALAGKELFEMGDRLDYRLQDSLYGCRTNFLPCKALPQNRDGCGCVRYSGSRLTFHYVLAALDKHHLGYWSCSVSVRGLNTELKSNYFHLRLPPTFKDEETDLMLLAMLLSVLLASLILLTYVWYRWRREHPPI